MKARLLGLVVLLVLAAFGYLQFPTDTSQRADVPPVPSDPVETTSRRLPGDVSPKVVASPTGGIRQIVEDAAIKNYGKVIYRGPVDLTKTIERIRAGVQHSHRNDGAVFGNRERLLPQKPRGYYREYVHPTDGVNGPGPQRLVVGRDGDWWYTPDHYASFIELGTEDR